MGITLKLGLCPGLDGFITENVDMALSLYMKISDFKWVHP